MIRTRIILIALAAVLCVATSCKKESDNRSFVPTTKTESKAETNLKRGSEYIANLAKKDSTIKVLPSGLAYKVVKATEGPSPTMDNTVTVHYTGKHANGAVFDSSVERGEPAEFPMNGVVRGFSEGISKMSKGSVYELYIPGPLGYGEQGQPMAGIEPNELLIFEVELIDFK